MPVRRFTVLIAALAAAGCSSPTESSPAPAIQYLVVAGGDAQEATPSQELPLPFLVRVSNTSGGMAGVEVTWRILSGTGEFLSPATVRTDALGEASVRFRPDTHRVTVVATIEGMNVSPAQFQTFPRSQAVYAELGSVTGCGNLCQRYTFYVDGTFRLEYANGASYPGTFTREGSELSLNFPESGLRPGATGIIEGDSLLVTYGLAMQLSDFANTQLTLQNGNPDLSSRPGPQE